MFCIVLMIMFCFTHFASRSAITSQHASCYWEWKRMKKLKLAERTIKIQVPGRQKMAIGVAFRLLNNIGCRESGNWKRFPQSVSAIKNLIEYNVWLHQVISISVKRLDLFVNLVVDLFYQFYLNSKRSTLLRNSGCDLQHVEFTILLFI